MNLHNITTPLRNVAMWFTVSGRNGRLIGTHIWPVEEGTPPDLGVETRPTWQVWNWSPSRFRWMPFNPDNVMRDGWVRPLCGHRSQSRFPRVWALDPTRTPCYTCQSEAGRRGMLVLSHNEAVLMSPQKQALNEEQADWEAAERPDTWPMS